MRQSQFDSGRVSAISDGVFAIAMTLLVLDLKLPDLGAGVSREAFAAAIVGPKAVPEHPRVPRGC